MYCINQAVNHWKQGLIDQFFMLIQQALKFTLNNVSRRAPKLTFDNLNVRLKLPAQHKSETQQHTYDLSEQLSCQSNI